MSTKTPKPRVMWANYYSNSVCFHSKKSHAVVSRLECATTIRVAVIPLDDCEAIVERALTAYFAAIPNVSIVGIRAALTAAGIPCKRKASK